MIPKDLPDLRALRYARSYQRIEYNPKAHEIETQQPFVIFGGFQSIYLLKSLADDRGNQI